VDEVVRPQGAVPVVRGPDGVVHAFGTDEDGVYRVYFPGVAQFEFHPPCLRLDALAARAAHEGLVEELFETTVQPLVLQLLGFEALHASAIRDGSRVVAFCGVSGTGKSTVAYGLSRRGQTLWADDVVVFDAEGRSAVYCTQIPSPARIRPATRGFFGADGDAILVDETESVERTFLHAIAVLERRGDGDDEVRQLDPVKALQAVLPHAYRFTLTDRQRTERTIVHYLDLVARVPVFLAAFVPGFKRFPEFLDELEDSLADLLG
jgi:hypothetical protein